MPQIFQQYLPVYFNYLFETPFKKNILSGMKNIIATFACALSALLCGCSTTQELNDGASFEGLKKFYVENSSGGDSFFRKFGYPQAVNQSLKNFIVEYLKTKGFAPVAEKGNAEIIFRPLWSESIRPYGDTIGNLPISVNSQMFNSTQTYLTLEIQAILPNDDKIWAWRGFAPEEITQNNFSDGTLKDMVVGCLEYFPPEKYPSRLQEHKEQKEKQRILSEQNPFKEVLIKERERVDNQIKAQN